MITATPQKDRQISFVLDDGMSLRTPVQFFIRPEELTRVEPSRLNTTQTLGGAWMDNFGPGLSTIQISGTTGWRMNPVGEDWETAFQRLRNEVFVEWHKLRKNKIEMGLNPDTVKLIFADTLDDIAAVVAPQAFTLRRSKVRPLLMQYNINLTVVSNRLTGSFESLMDEVTDLMTELGLESMARTIVDIKNAADKANTWVQNEIVRPIQKFLMVTTRILTAVQNAVRSVGSVVGSLATAARSIVQSGMNIFRTLGNITGLPLMIKGQAMGVAALFTNAFCLLNNAFKSGKLIPDYSLIYGASTCSSTVGGSPLSSFHYQNPFSLMAAGSNSPVSINQSASTSLSAVLKSDPVLSPLNQSNLAIHAGNIADGTTLA